MALYQEYEAKILTENGIDIQDDGTKRDIQNFDQSVLQLPTELLKRIQEYIGEYNYLTKNSFRLRYYQVLALLLQNNTLPTISLRQNLDWKTIKMNVGC